MNTPWYLLFALFWAMLWRPRSGGEAALAATVAFAAASSNALAVFAPLVLARVIALPRVREHAASPGWAAGGALQVVAVLRSPGIHQTGYISAGLDFYLHDVLVTAVAGRHFAAVLAAQAGPPRARRSRPRPPPRWPGGAGHRRARVRLFVATALGLGLALVLAAAIARGWGTLGWTGRRHGVAATRPRPSCSSIRS